MDVAKECRELVKNEGINLASTIEYEVNDEEMSLTLEYIIDTYMQASEESQLVFYTALQKSMESGNMGIEKFFEGMGQLLLLTHLSDKFES